LLSSKEREVLRKHFLTWVINEEKTVNHKKF
jgi:hypothetical protein